MISIRDCIVEYRNMAATATWFTILGFILLVLGFVLRTIAMMQAGDASRSQGRVLYGHALLQQHRRLFPKSPMPLLAHTMILSGVLLLLAGVGIEISR
jgi:hypothetical protein